MPDLPGCGNSDPRDVEIERLREALAFYALSLNWNLQAPESEQSPVGLDGGDCARHALDG